MFCLGVMVNHVRDLSHRETNCIQDSTVVAAFAHVSHLSTEVIAAKIDINSGHGLRELLVARGLSMDGGESQCQREVAASQAPTLQTRPREYTSIGDPRLCETFQELLVSDISTMVGMEIEIDSFVFHQNMGQIRR